MLLAVVLALCCGLYCGTPTVAALKIQIHRTHCTQIWVCTLALCAVAMQFLGRRERLAAERAMTVVFIALLGAAGAVAVFVPDRGPPPLPNGTETYGLPLEVFYSGYASTGVVRGLLCFQRFAVFRTNRTRPEREREREKERERERTERERTTE